jgi:hypothetical protein
MEAKTESKIELRNLQNTIKTDKNIQNSYINNKVSKKDLLRLNTESSSEDDSDLEKVSVTLPRKKGGDNIATVLDRFLQKESEFIRIKSKFINLKNDNERLEESFRMKNLESNNLRIENDEYKEKVVSLEKNLFWSRTENYASRGVLFFITFLYLFMKTLGMLGL